MSRNIFTDNPDFYPTPRSLADLMANECCVAGKVVLEPSAGKGDLVTALLDAGAAQILACENDPNLLWTLQMEQSQDARFLFLKENFFDVRAKDVSHIEAIVMNPPFSNAAEHILHALDIAPAGCDIVALCNNDSFENGKNTTWQKLREAVAANGDKTFFESAFTKAERTTNVRVAMLTLHKTAEETDPFADYFLSDEDDIPVGGHTAGLMPYNAIRDIVNRYVEACRMFKQVDKMSHKINEIAQYKEKTPDKNHEYAPYPPITFGARLAEGHGAAITFDTYCKEMQKYYWDIIFHKLNLEKYSTTKLKEQLNRFIEQQHDMPFTMRNIYNVLDVVIQTNDQRMKEALVEAFERICSFADENSSAGEKWKTNSDYMINRRFIVPWMCAGRSYGWNNETVRIIYNASSKLDDINKALCYITGRSYESIPDIRNFEANKAKWGQWYEWGFFRIRFYKKGTVHCEFLDEDVWYRFNAEVARIKGWALPRRTSQNKKRA